MMTMNKINLTLSLAILAFLVLGCSTIKDTKAVDPAIEKFHTQYNAKQFKEIYEQSGDMMKDAATEKDMVELLEAMHRKLGTYKTGKFASWHVNSGPLSSQVRIEYDSEFTDGNGTETFIFSVAGEVVKLEGYYVNSKEFLLK